MSEELPPEGPFTTVIIACNFEVAGQTVAVTEVEVEE